MDRNRRDLLRFLGKLTALALPLLAAYELAEGGWLRGDELGSLLLQPNVKRTRSVRYCGRCPARSVRFATDGFGFRAERRDYSGIDVLSVGSSTTLQADLNLEETWQARLEARFARDGRPLAILNAGVDGQSSRGFLRDFELWFPRVPRLKPRYAIVLLGSSEVVGQDDDEFSAKMDSLAAPARGWRERSALWRAARGLWHTWYGERFLGRGHRAVDFASLTWTTAPLSPAPYPEERASVARFRERLSRLTAAVRGFGAEPLYVLGREAHYRSAGNGAWEGIATVTRTREGAFNGLDFLRVSGEIADTLASHSAEQRVAYVDLSRLEGISEGDFLDLTHMTPAGAGKLADALYPRLRPMFP